MNDPPADDRVAGALDAAYEALASGEAPPADLPPDLRGRLDRALPVLQQLRREFGRPAPVPGGDPPARYTLRRLHAMGGVGEVWLATDRVLGREVALKELRPERTADGRLLRRLLQEARVTGRLQHPGVVPVYELVEDPDDGVPFFTMRYVRGRTLADAARGHHARPGEPGRAVGFVALVQAFVSVCQTVAYAHSRGVIHRDLKGHNVLLGEYGEVVVIDWGFAKVAGRPDDAPAGDDADGPEGEGLTLAGSAVGTPAYMAPEQAAADGSPVDERTDVYGLGAILYEVLTGQPPYFGENSADVLRQVRLGPPPDPRAVGRSAPPALAAVCRKAMARDPGGRYAAAADLARDVQRWLADEPPLAYREPVGERLGRLARRHRSAVVVLAALAAAAGVGAVLLGREQARSSVALAETKANATVAMFAGQAEVYKAGEEEHYRHRLALAEREVGANNFQQAAQLLADCMPARRDWEWHCLDRLCRAGPVVLRGHGDAVAAVAFRPAGAEELASAGFDGGVRVWDVAAGTPRLTLAGHGGPAVVDVAYRRDGLRLLTAGADGTARVWDADTGAECLRVAVPGGRPERARFRPDGKAFVTVGGGAARVWDAGTGRPLTSTPAGWSVRGAAYLPDGGLRAVIGGSPAREWADVDRAVVVGPAPGVEWVVREVVCDPAAARVASASGDLDAGGQSEVTLTDPATGVRLAALRGHAAPVLGLAFRPDGLRLASAGTDRVVKLWDPATGRAVLTLHGHADAVRCVAFSRDGRFLAAGGADRTVRVWDAGGPAPAAPAHLRRTLTPPETPTPVLALSFAPNGDTLVASGHRPARVWDPRAGRLVGSWDPASWRSASLAHSPDGRTLLVGGSNGQASLVDPATGKARRAWAAHGSSYVAAATYRPGGREFATAGYDAAVRVWAADGTAVRELRGHRQAVAAVAYRPDGRELASASWDGTVRVWDADTGKEVRRLEAHAGRVGPVAYSADGGTLAAGCGDGAVRLWDARTYEPRGEWVAHAGEVTGLAFAPDGRRLASAGADWAARLWRLGSGKPEEARAFRGHVGRVAAVAFAPGGATLATAGFDGTVRVWDARAE